MLIPLTWIKAWANNLTDKNRINVDRDYYALLLEAESLSNKRFLKEPRDLICGVLVNEPLGAD